MITLVSFKTGDLIFFFCVWKSPDRFPTGHGLSRGQAWAGQSLWAWLRLQFWKAEAAKSQALPTAFRPSRAGTTLLQGPSYKLIAALGNDFSLHRWPYQCYHWHWTLQWKSNERKMKASTMPPKSYTQTTTFVAGRRPSPLCLLLIGAPPTNLRRNWMTTTPGLTYQGETISFLPNVLWI